MLRRRARRKGLDGDAAPGVGPSRREPLLGFAPLLEARPVKPIDLLNHELAGGFVVDEGGLVFSADKPHQPEMEADLVTKPFESVVALDDVKPVEQRMEL